MSERSIKLLVKRTGKKLPLILMIFLGISCALVATKRAELDFYMGDYKNKQIINDNGNTILSDDMKFNDYACIHKEKIKTLKALLAQ